MSYICKENLKINIWKMKKYCRVRDHCNFTAEYTAALHRICDLKYSVSKKFFAAFHNGSNCDYNFIINELAEELKYNLLI